MSADQVKLPIAETFHSIQGEGTYVGTPMHFIRTAGCSVGRPASTVLRVDAGHMDAFPVLPTGKPAWGCKTYDGRLFWCDTDFNKYEEKTPEELIHETWERHICSTGGEPLIHGEKLFELWRQARDRNILVHVETSGTIEFDPKQFGVWLTVAPKDGVLDHMVRMADEVKILVDPKFHPDSLPESVRVHKNVFLCPVNEISHVDKVNVERCMFWLRQFPTWRLGTQLHKFLEVR